MAAATFAAPAHAGTLQRRLAGRPLFRGWEAMQFRSIENHSALLTVPAGERVFDIDGVQRYDHFLLRGRLRLRVRGRAAFRSMRWRCASSCASRTASSSASPVTTATSPTRRGRLPAGQSLQVLGEARQPRQTPRELLA